MPKKIELVKEASSKRLLNKPGVTGVGTGKKIVNGVPTEQDAILVFVQKKRSQKTIRTQGVNTDIIPDEIDGIPTDIIEVGEISLHKGFRNKVRPIKPGYSISHGKVTAGTIGGFFYDRDGDLVALSNFHVLANDGKAKPGDIIYQPGTADSSGNLKFNGWSNPITKHPYIGTLKRFYPLSSNGQHEQDSAIAAIHPELVKGGYVDTIYPELGKALKGFTIGQIGDNVYKCGRTTGFTGNRIIAQNATFSIAYGFGNCTLKNIILTNAMSAGGDSGSLGITVDMEAFGLLFAGSQKVTLFNPIQPIVDYYGLQPIETIQEHTTNWKGFNWKTASTDGKITFHEDAIELEDNAHQHCYIETECHGQTRYRALVNTGSDKGKAWGIGVALIFPKGNLKLNLQFNGAFGSYINQSKDITTGKVTPNTDYYLTIKKRANCWEGMIFFAENKRKIEMFKVPFNVVGTDPILFRVGKIGDNFGPRDFSKSGPQAGPIGISTIKEIKILKKLKSSSYGSF